MTNAGFQRKRLTKKIDNKHIIWFDQSNTWIQLEEPAWYVYSKYNSGVEPEKIIKLFSKRYYLSSDESEIFIQDIIKEFLKLNTSPSEVSPNLLSQIPASPKEFFSSHTYLINNKIILISYGSRLLDYMIHEYFAHLETKKKSKLHFQIEVFDFEDSSVLKIADKVWVEDNANSLKRKLLIEMTNLIYGKSEKDWLTYIHGSAISNGLETIVLSAACGSGKSTLAALLCKSGLEYVSDDYVPIDSRLGKAYSFPAALSVKDGAYSTIIPLYEELKEAKEYHFKGSKKTTKYLSFPISGDFYKPHPVKNLVFVLFDKDRPYSFKKVDTVEAFRRFNQEAWISPLPAHARMLIKWFMGISCYELVYSDNEKAIAAIKELFET